MFVGTRRSAQSEAKNLAKRVRKRLVVEDPERLKKLEPMPPSSLDEVNPTSPNNWLRAFLRALLFTMRV